MYLCTGCHACGGRASHLSPLLNLRSPAGLYHTLPPALYSSAVDLTPIFPSNVHEHVEQSLENINQTETPGVDSHLS
jgi:hypothetical protein